MLQAQLPIPLERDMVCGLAVRAPSLRDLDSCKAGIVDAIIGLPDCPSTPHFQLLACPRVEEGRRARSGIPMLVYYSIPLPSYYFGLASLAYQGLSRNRVVLDERSVTHRVSDGKQEWR